MTGPSGWTNCGVFKTDGLADQMLMRPGQIHIRVPEAPTEAPAALVSGARASRPPSNARPPVLVNSWQSWEVQDIEGAAYRRLIRWEPVSEGGSIRLFLADGTPGGLLTAEIMNWTGHVVAAPRSDLAALLKRSETSRTGIYILLGDDPENFGGTLAYIGEGDEVRTVCSSMPGPRSKAGKISGIANRAHQQGRQPH